MSNATKICKVCHVSQILKSFQLMGRNHDGRSHICNKCLYKQKKPSKIARKKERDFWAQFSPI